MRKLAPALILAAVIGAPPALAPAAFAQAAAPLPAPDFIRAAAQSDEFEIATSRVALHRAATPAVRRFAGMMINQHMMTTRGLKQAIRMGGHTPPPPPPLSPDQQAKLAALRAAGPRDFDRVYMDQQVAAHEKTLGVVKAYASGGDAPNLRKAAVKTVPIVQHHLEMARGLSQRG